MRFWPQIGYNVQRPVSGGTLMYIARDAVDTYIHNYIRLSS